RFALKTGRAERVGAKAWLFIPLESLHKGTGSPSSYPLPSAVNRRTRPGISSGPTVSGSEISDPRSLPEAQTRRRSPGGNTTEGNIHFQGLSGRSDKPQPSRSTSLSPRLISSIQSDASPSSSRRVEPFEV